MPEIEDIVIIIIAVTMVIAFFKSLLKNDVALEMNNASPPLITRQKSYYTSSNYNPALVQRIAFKTMETLYIMSTSTAVDTIIGRYPVFAQSIDVLKSAQSNARYNSDIQLAIDNYKTVYYDRIPDDFQLAALVNPTCFDIAFFYCACLLSGLRKYVSMQNKAGQKYIDKIVSLIQMVRKEVIEKCGSLQNVFSLIAQLDDIKTGFRN